MLPNSQNNSAQVKRMLYSKNINVKGAKNAVADDDDPDSPDSETSAAADKKLRDIEEIFTRHSSTSTVSESTEVKFDGSILTPSKLNNIKSSDDKSYVYPFISRKIFTAPNLTKPKSKSKSKVNVCIFHVFNTRQGDPFLQFKLQKSNDSTTSLSFPIATVPANETTESAWKNAADESVRRWFPETSDSIKWKGIRADPITDELYAMYEEVYDDAAADDVGKIEKNPISVKSEWWWACVHEIMNRNKLLSFDIHSTVIDLFEHVPAIMFLYDRQTGYILEIPHVLYSGITEGSTLDELVDLGPIKIIDNTFLKGDDGASGATDVNRRSIYGTQHYLYEYESVFRSACYHYHGLKNAKRSDPHLFRHAVFLGNTMINMFDANNTTTVTSVADIRNYANTTWASNGYKSVHHGRYKLPNANKNKKRGSGSDSDSRLYLDPVFCVSNNERIVTLGHYKINVKSVPSKFNDGDEDAIDKYELL
jgi:hypothetical protein